MKTILVAAALAAAWSGAPATAQATRTVAVHDLDLSRPADVARLDRRIASAAHRVCVDPSSAVYGNYAAARTCVTEAKRVALTKRDAAVTAAQGTALAAR